jgi:hypothetical protein
MGLLHLRERAIGTFLGLLLISVNGQPSPAQEHQLDFNPTILSYVRIDPIVDPSATGMYTTSEHLHVLVGPEVLSSDSTPNQLREATCTSFSIGGTAFDMSG